MNAKPAIGKNGTREQSMNGKAYQVISSWDGDVLKIDMTGSITGPSILEDGQEMTRMTNALLDEHKPAKVLIDVRGLIGRFSIVDSWYHLNEYEPSQHIPHRLAVVDNPENREYFTFAETAGRNAGLQARYFEDIDSAKRWLSETANQST